MSTIDIVLAKAQETLDEVQRMAGLPINREEIAALKTENARLADELAKVTDERNQIMDQTIATMRERDLLRTKLENVAAAFAAIQTAIK